MAELRAVSRTSLCVLVPALVLAACGDFRPGTRLELLTDSAGLGTDSCPRDPIPPLHLVRDGTRVSFVDAATGTETSLVWPVGFAAWEIAGIAVVHAADGKVIGREGETLSNIRAMQGVRPDGLRVCAVGVRTYQ